MKLIHGKLCVGILVFLLVLIASFIGTYVGQQFADQTVNDRPIVLNADTASSGKSMSMATGLVDRKRGVEGILSWIIFPDYFNVGWLIQGVGRLPASFRPTSTNTSNWAKAETSTMS